MSTHHLPTAPASVKFHMMASIDGSSFSFAVTRRLPYAREKTSDACLGFPVVVVVNRDLPGISMGVL